MWTLGGVFLGPAGVALACVLFAVESNAARPPYEPPPPTGLPEGATCAPLLDQCDIGLTCRMLAASDGRCRPTGPLPQGATCSGTDECGYAMICAQAPDTMNRCMVICDTTNPTRCGLRQTCETFTGIAGLCLPPR